MPLAAAGMAGRQLRAFPSGDRCSAAAAPVEAVDGECQCSPEASADPDPGEKLAFGPGASVASRLYRLVEVKAGIARVILGRGMHEACDEIIL